jgi:hypothetical protein
VPPTAPVKPSVTAMLESSDKRSSTIIAAIVEGPQIKVSPDEPGREGNRC